MLTGFLCAALAAVLVLLCVLYRRVDQLPARLRLLLAEERRNALDELQQATAARVASATATLRIRENELAQRLRAEVAAGQLRARLAERRSANAAGVFDSATALMGELRATIDQLHQVVGDQRAEEERCTIEIPNPAPTHAAGAAEEHEPPDEPTQVGPRRAALDSCVVPRATSGNEGAP
jgi:hypothetical protein